MYTIRPARPAEAPAIIDFQLAMAWQTEQLMLDRPTVAAGVQAVFADPAKGTYYVAAWQEEVIACLLTTPEWSEWRNGTVLWIQSVFVQEAHRRRGVFRRMYQYLQEKVRRTPELMGLRLYVEKTNLPAQKVYRAIGMNGDHYHFFEWMKNF